MFRKLSILLWRPDAGLCPQTEAVVWGDGVNWVAGAGAESVCRLFLLWDCHRRVHHHSPGDINPQKKKIR